MATYYDLLTAVKQQVSSRVATILQDISPVAPVGWPLDSAIIAAAQGNVDIFALLINHQGVDQQQLLASTNRLGQNALIIAMEYHNQGIIEYIFEHKLPIDFNHIDRFGRTAIFYPCIHNRLDWLQLMLATEKDFDATTKDYYFTLPVDYITSPEVHELLSSSHLINRVPASIEILQALESGADTLALSLIKRSPKLKLEPLLKLAIKFHCTQTAIFLRQQGMVAATQATGSQAAGSQAASEETAEDARFRLFAYQNLPDIGQITQLLLQGKDYPAYLRIDKLPKEHLDRPLSSDDPRTLVDLAFENDCIISAEMLLANGASMQDRGGKSLAARAAAARKFPHLLCKLVTKYEPHQGANLRLSAVV